MQADTASVRILLHHAGSHGERRVRAMLDERQVGGHQCCAPPSPSPPNRDPECPPLAHLWHDGRQVGGHEGCALHCAAEHGSSDVISLLITYGAEPRIRSGRHETAAQVAEMPHPSPDVSVLN